MLQCVTKHLEEDGRQRLRCWRSALTAGLPQLAGAETVLRIGMTAADIPRTLGQPDQGFEGNRFTGLTMYDALTMWDLSSADKPSVMIPGLSTEWKVDDADKKKWTFKLRPGVTFHDGSPFNADAVVWNVEKVLKQDAPQFDASQVGVTASRMPTLASAAQDRRHDGGIDHQGAGQLPADQPHQSVHGEPCEMAEAVRGRGRR